MRVLVVPHALEGGLAQGSLVGPLRPGDLADELGLAPHREPRLRARRLAHSERAVRALPLAQLLGQESEGVLLQARADPAGEMERLLLASAKLRSPLVVIAHEHRADPLGATALAGDVAPD